MSDTQPAVQPEDYSSAMFAAFANDIQEEKERITTEGSFEKEPIF